MTIPELPADVRRFILTSVPSVPYLEAVLLLRADPRQAWTGPRLAQRLYVPERTAAELLVQLRDGGVAEPAADAGVRFAPGPELADVLNRPATRRAGPAPARRLAMPPAGQCATVPRLRLRRCPGNEA